MAKTDEGEFELVLGNRQLISVFLIVVILLGVFFSMGYIVGRNSAPGAVDARNIQQTPSKPIVVEPPQTARTDTATPPAGSEPSSAPPAAQPRSVPAATEPVASEPRPAPRKEPPATHADRKTEPPSARASAAIVEQPPTGKYWQVVSTSRPEAEIISEAIAKKGLRALVTPAPKDGYFRVLVGPMSETADISRTRTQLEAAGFKNPILQHY